MRFVPGLLLGVALGAVTMWLVRPPSAAPAQVGDLTAPDTTQAEGANAEREPMLSGAPRAAPSSVAIHPIPDHALRIGDGLDLVAGEVRRQGAAPVDLVVHDITEIGVSLGTPHGGEVVRIPLGALAVPSDPARLFEATHDAPETLEATHVELRYQSDRAHSGVGLLATAEGAAHAVAVTGHTWQVSALARHVTLKTKQVPVRVGGGIAALLAGAAPERPPMTTGDLERLQGHWAAMNKTGIPFLKSRGRALTGDLTVTHDAPEVLEIGPKTRTFLPGGHAGELTLGVHAAAVIDGDAELAAESEIDAFSTLVVRGDLTGQVQVGFHALLVVEGDLLGEVHLKGHASVQVRGLHRGRMHLGSWSKLLLERRPAGEILGKSDHLTLMLDASVARDEMPRLFGRAWGRHGKLVVRHSDLPDGKHEKVHGWSEIHVGGAAWEAFEALR